MALEHILNIINLEIKKLNKKLNMTKQKKKLTPAQKAAKKEYYDKLSRHREKTKK